MRKRVQRVCQKEVVAGRHKTEVRDTDKDSV